MTRVFSIGTGWLIFVGDRGMVSEIMKVAGARNGDRVALELMRGDLKTGKAGGRTPLEILASFLDTGDLAELDLWKKWERATEGQHFSQWSQGLKARVRIEECDDEDIMEDEVGGEVLYRFTLPEWRAICATSGAQARLLDIAEERGELGVRRYLREIVGPSRWRFHDGAETAA